MPGIILNHARFYIIVLPISMKKHTTKYGMTLTMFSIALEYHIVDDNLNTVIGIQPLSPRLFSTNEFLKSCSNQYQEYFNLIKLVNTN